MSSTTTKTRRALSMPTRFVLPSEEMGEYEETGGGPYRRRSAPSKGGLYPLREEGTYGSIPRDPPPPPPPYKSRDKKPKTYSSYSIDQGCRIHSKKIAELEKDHGIEHMAKQPAARRHSSYTQPHVTRKLSSNTSSSSRGASLDRASISPDPVTTTNGYPSSGLSKKNAGRTWSSSSSRKYSSSMNTNTYRFEENEEYEYEENQKKYEKRSGGGGFGKYSKDIETGMSQVSLDGMRKPNITSWDSMGILGLSNKMWHDTKKRQESFLQSTGHFLREDKAMGPYVM